MDLELLRYILLDLQHILLEMICQKALGAENSVPWEHFENPIDAAEHILKNGQELVLLEQTMKSKNLYDLDYPFPLCFIVGNEVMVFLKNWRVLQQFMLKYL